MDMILNDTNFNKDQSFKRPEILDDFKLEIEYVTSDKV